MHDTYPKHMIEITTKNLIREQDKDKQPVLDVRKYRSPKP